MAARISETVTTAKMANRHDGGFRYYDDPLEFEGDDLLDAEADGSTTAADSDAADSEGQLLLPGLKTGQTPSTSAQKALLWYQAQSPRAVLVVITFMLFAMVLSAVVLIIPLARLIEDDLCRRYYNTHEPIEEERCKVDEIQARLAWLGGAYGFVHAIIGTLRCSVSLCVPEKKKKKFRVNRQMPRNI